MTGNMKRLIAGTLATVLVFASATFIAWGFDPAGWRWIDRLTFVGVLMFALFFAGLAPFQDDEA